MTGHVSTWHDATILHTQILLILSLRRGCKVLAGCWLFFLNTNSSYNPMSPSKQNEEPGALLLSSAHRKNSPSLRAPSYVLEKGYHIWAIHFCDQSWGLADSARNSENTEKWEQFATGCNMYSHFSLFLEHHLSPKSQGWVILRFSLAPNMWCLYQQQPIPQTSTRCPTSPFTSDGNPWSYCRFCRLRAQDCPQFRCQPCYPESPLIWQYV